MLIAVADAALGDLRVQQVAELPTDIGGVSREDAAATLRQPIAAAG